MISAIRHVHLVVRIDEDVVGQREKIVAPGIEKAPVAVEDDDLRSRLPVDDVDPVSRIGGVAGNDAELEPPTSLTPPRDIVVLVIAVANAHLLPLSLESTGEVQFSMAQRYRIRPASATRGGE